MKSFECCPASSWVPVRDFGHADSFEFDLGKCSACGKHWMHIYCVANHVTSFESVKDEDLEGFHSIPAGKDLKIAVREWFYKYVE